MEDIKQIIKNIMKVENMVNNKGNIIPNQFIIYGDGWELFQSYKSPIALKKDGKVYLFKDWVYSVTTGKYRNMFLHETKRETEQKIKSGEYLKVDF